jgi:zinc and cadmium transporter
MNGFSMSAATSLSVYCVLVFLASLAGGWVLMAIQLVHTRLQIAVSFVAGLMLAMALLHFIPHAFHQQHSLDQTVGWALVGFLVMFFLQRFFHYHHHDVSEDGHEEHPHVEHPEPSHSHRLSWVGVALGLSLHSLLDGLAMGASVASDARVAGAILGLGAAMAVILHKPFDAMAISTLMTAAGCSKASRHLINVLFALLSPLGALLFFYSTSNSSPENAFVGGALAFCAGTFLCIACTDLLPELQFHSHDRLKLSVALLAGIGVAILIGQFETSGHDLGHDAQPQVQSTNGVAGVMGEIGI